MHRVGAVALAAAVVAAIASAEAFALGPALLDQPGFLDNLSSQCSDDIKVIYSDQDFVGVMQDISHKIVSVTLGEKNNCLALPENCWTPFALGTCCSIDGMAYWKNNTDTVEALKAAGRKADPGKFDGQISFLSQVITTDWQNPITIMTFAQSYVQPIYAPDSCLNFDDAQAIADAASRQCHAANNIPGADTMACTLVWA